MLPACVDDIMALNTFREAQSTITHTQNHIEQYLKRAVREVSNPRIFAKVAISKNSSLNEPTTVGEESFSSAETTDRKTLYSMD